MRKDFVIKLEPPKVMIVLSHMYKNCCGHFSLHAEFLWHPWQCDMGNIPYSLLGVDGVTGSFWGGDDKREG